MNRPRFALSLMLVAMAGSILGVEKGHGGQIMAWTQQSSRLDICPLAAGEYFGCEYGVYAPPIADGPPTADDDWDYYDEAYQVTDDSLVVDDPVADAESPFTDERQLTSETDAVAANPTRCEAAANLDHDRCLSGYDPAYDAAVYGVCNEDEVVSTLAAHDAARHVEADYEFTFDEYAAVYDVDTMRGAHIYVAEFPARDEACDWDEHLYDDLSASDDFYADDYEAYEYNCHYGRNPWAHPREESATPDRAAEGVLASDVGQSDPTVQSDAASEPEAVAGDELSNTAASDYGDAYWDEEAYWGELAGDYPEETAPAQAEAKSTLDPQTRQALEDLLSSPLAQSARSLTGNLAADALAAVEDFDWISAFKSAVRYAGQMQREAARQEMIAYYGLDQDEYAWSDANYFYENYYAVDFTAKESPLQRMAQGCGREVILDAAGTLDHLGAALQSASRQLQQMVESP